MKKSCSHCLLKLNFILLLTGLLLIIIIPTLFHKQIIKKTVLQNGSELFDAWLTPPVPVFIQFSLFSVLNPVDVVNGQRPIVKQLGPFTYREFSNKLDIVIHQKNRTICYREKKYYIFQPHLSVGNETDRLTILNLAYVSIAQQANNLPGFINFILRTLELYYQENLFVEKTVYETIWGYSDIILEKINAITPITTVVGLFAGKNNSIGNRFLINDGVADSSMLGKIVSYNDSTTLRCWGTTLANQIKGSDGTLIPPFRSELDSVYVFSADICRSFEFTSIGILSVHKIPVIRFSPAHKSFLSPEFNPDNRGFCLDFPVCEKSGVLNMSSCNPGAPVFISLPHFNQADKSYLENVIGMNPTDDMVTRLDVEANTGIILNAQKMIQINGVIRQNTNFKYLAKVRNTLLPMGYLNESFSVSEELAVKLRYSLILPIFWVKIISLSLTAVCSVGVFIFLAICIFDRHPEIKTVNPLDEEAPLLNNA